MGITVPKLEDYDIKVLIALGNQADDPIRYARIKYIIVERLFEKQYPIFYLIHNFQKSDKILRDAYAEVITMSMKNNEYSIDEDIILDIIELVSLDTLMYYGMESNSLDFCKKCREEFWDRALEVEDKIELRRKINFGKKRSKKSKY